MSKSLLIPLSLYQKDRVQFSQKIAELSSNPKNVEYLHKAGIISLLRPLLLDNVPSVQQNAALSLGRLANYSEEIAESILQSDIISQLIYSLSKSNRFLKKSACFVFKSIAKHSGTFADTLVKSGVLPPLSECLDEFDPSVKEAACLALCYISKHNAFLAYQVVESKSLEKVVLCLQEPEILLKRAAALTLANISQHNEKIAEQTAEIGLDTVVNFLGYNDTQLKRNITLLLGNLCKHSQELASLVLAKINNIQKLLQNLKDPDDIVKKNTSYCICEIVNKSPENAQTVIFSGGGCSLLVDYISQIKGDPVLYGILSLGFISAYNSNLAMSVIKAKAIQPLRECLQNEPHQHIKAACCYSLGHIGRHSPQHAAEVTKYNVLSLMLFYYMDTKSNDDLKEKSKKGLKKIVDSCNDLESLTPLIQVAPKNILKHILKRFAINLKDNKNELKKFLINGGLQKIQEIKKNADGKIMVIIDEINSFYPDNIIQYYSPDYAINLLNKLDKFSDDLNK